MITKIIDRKNKQTHTQINGIGGFESLCNTHVQVHESLLSAMLVLPPSGRGPTFAFVPTNP